MLWADVGEGEAPGHGGDLEVSGLREYVLERLVAAIRWPRVSASVNASIPRTAVPCLPMRAAPASGWKFPGMRR